MDERQDHGDQRELVSLYGVLRSDLLRFLLARTGDAAEAEDVAQELWIKLQAGTPGPIGNARSYLFRMAQHLVVDRLRERQRRMRRDRRWADDRAGGQVWTDAPDPSASAEEAMIEREEVAVLTSALATLPSGARRVFELHKLQGMSHVETATTLAISRSGVEKHMAVAMKYLRRALLD